MQGEISRAHSRETGEERRGRRSDKGSLPCPLGQRLQAAPQYPATWNAVTSMGHLGPMKMRAKSQQGKETPTSLVPKATGLLPQSQVAALKIIT